MCAVTFFLSLFIASAVINKGSTDMTAEMGGATLPLVYMGQTVKINCLHGYLGPVQGESMRDTITPMGKDRKVPVLIEKFGNEIKRFSFEVRSIDGERLVESTEVKKYETEDDLIRAQITVKDLIEPETEYNLIIILLDQNGREIRYYTRILQAEDYHVDEKIAFVKNFHEKTFDKEAAESITMYMESNAEGDNSSFSHVDIHSSFQQITWGNLNVTPDTDPVYDIKMISPSLANIELTYQVRIGEEEDTRVYNVTEWYRIRYTEKRIYLLDYQRDMGQIFDPENEIFANNKIVLGINPADYQLTESEDGHVVAFVGQNRLYSYNIIENRFATLFGFYRVDTMDRRSLYDHHDITILNMDETGNIRFMVSGYMNCGRHEGENGIQINYYNSVMNTVEEEAFIPDDRSYEMLKTDVQKLLYEDNGTSLYIYLAGSAYEINLETKNYSAIASDLKENSFRVSKSGRMFAWKSGEQENLLYLMNFANKKRSEVTVSANMMIMPLGFMDEDLIYGIAKNEDVKTDITGRTVIPMYELRIQNENGEVLKRYGEEGVFVIDASIRDNQILLERVKLKEDGTFEETIGDQIMNNEEAAMNDNKAESVVTEDFETIRQIAAKAEIPRKGMKFLRPKEVLFEGGREVNIEAGESKIPHFYVYALRGMISVYTEAAKAVNAATEVSGYVTNDDGDYVWKAGDRSVRNQIMKIQGDLATEERGSLAVCLDTMLSYEGIARNTAYMLAHGDTTVDILKDNLKDCQVLELSGCSLNAMLYYVNRDIPVLVMMNDGNAVLLIGFNELNTVLMDPLTGQVFKKGMNDSADLFAQNGNAFLTYVKKTAS